MKSTETPIGEKIKPAADRDRIKRMEAAAEAELSKTFY
jgi:hypothetical protein